MTSMLRTMGYVAALCIALGECRSEAQVSSPVGEGICVTLGYMPNALEQVEAVGGYCSLSGCKLSGTIYGPRAYFGVVDAGVVAVTANTVPNAGIYSRVPGNSVLTFAAAGVGRWEIDGNGELYSLTPLKFGDSTVPIGSINISTWIQSTGTSTGSLPACNAGQTGSTEFDISQSLLADCQNRSGSYNWRYPLYAGGANTNTAREVRFLGTYYSGAIVAPETTDFMGEGPSFFNDSSVRIDTNSTIEIACAWETVGAGGTKVEVNFTDGTRTCTCQYPSCTTAIRTNVRCACTPSGTFTQGSATGPHLQFTSVTDCGTNPGTVRCSVWGSLTSN